MAAAVATLVLLAGCTLERAEIPRPGPPDVDVDTAALRQAKAEVGVEPCRSGGASPTADGLPEVTLPCLGGGDDVEMASLRGPLIVNFWQTFCVPCREEMPALQEFHEAYGERVGVLGVDYLDVNPAGALDLARETGVTYPLVADVGGEMSAAGGLPVLRGMPALAFVDADGRVTETVFGGVTSRREIVELVEQYLGVRL